MGFGIGICGKCCGGTTCATVCITDTGCSAAVTGTTITLTGPGTVTGSPCTSSLGVNTVTITNSGSGYTSAPNVAFSGGGGSGAAATTALVTSGVTAYTVTAGGSGYTSRPTVTVTPSAGAGGGATANAFLLHTTVASVTVTNGGSGYTSAPTVAFTSGGGTGATATAVLTGGVVTSITITGGGSNYTFPPTVGFSGGGGAGAAGTAVLAPTSVNLLQVGAAGSGYVAAPTVTISGGGGSGATATGTVSATAGHLQSVNVTAAGSGYTSAPTVTIDAPPSGTTATGTSTLAARCCFSVSAIGSYTYSASGPSSNHWGTATGSVIVTACGTVNVATASLGCVAPTAPTGYFNYGTCGCVQDKCCPDSLQAPDPAWQTISWPNTLFCNDGTGLVTLTLNSSVSTSSAHVTYYGCATRTAASAETGGDCAGTHTTASGASVPVLFTLQCDGSTHGAWTLSVSTAGGDLRTTIPSAGTCNASTGQLLNYCGAAVFSGGASGSAVVTGCSPFAGTFPVAFGSATGAGVQQVYGTSTINMSVSP